MCIYIYACIYIYTYIDVKYTYKIYIYMYIFLSLSLLSLFVYHSVADGKSRETLLSSILSGLSSSRESAHRSQAWDRKHTQKLLLIVIVIVGGGSGLKSAVWRYSELMTYDLSVLVPRLPKDGPTAFRKEDSHCFLRPRRRWFLSS